MRSALLLDQHAELDFYHSARSLKRQSAGRHAAPLGHIIRHDIAEQLLNGR
jgi:hypothetical protein